MARKVYMPRVDWEVLQEEHVIEKITRPGPLPARSKAIRIRRGSHYELSVSAEGEVKAFGERLTPDDDVALGTILQGETVEGTDYHGLNSFELTGVLVPGYNTSFDSRTHTGAFKAELIVSDVVLESRRPRPTQWLTEWYVNGPREDMLFCRTTERSIQENYRRVRGTPDEPDNGTEFETCTRSEAPVTDYLQFSTGQQTVTVHTSPDERVPSWTVGLGIEYHTRFGEIPDAKTREAVAELTSFVFGRHLLSVGHSEYDQLGSLVRAKAISPWGRDVHRASSSLDYPPVRVSGEYQTWGKAEDVLNELCPAYLLRREEFSLGEAIWSYWIARRLPLGSNLPILASSLETMMSAWYRSNHSRSRGVYMDQARFQELIQPWIGPMSVELTKLPYGDRIVRKMRSSFQMGVNERFEHFFDELGLTIGSGERAAFRARNRMAHGVSVASEEISSMVALSRSYETLLHRVILRLLGYKGKYIDYSVVGFPERELEEPIGYPG